MQEEPGCKTNMLEAKPFIVCALTLGITKMYKALGFYRSRRIMEVPSDSALEEAVTERWYMSRARSPVNGRSILRGEGGGGP